MAPPPQADPPPAPPPERYLFGLCLSVWLSTLRRRGKSPERLFTGDLTLNCRYGNKLLEELKMDVRRS